MSNLILSTDIDANGDTVSLFSLASGILCECGSTYGYLDTVTADAGHTLGTLEWTCGHCCAGNREVLTGAHVGQAFAAMRA